MINFPTRIRALAFGIFSAVASDPGHAVDGVAAAATHSDTNNYLQDLTKIEASVLEDEQDLKSQSDSAHPQLLGIKQRSLTGALQVLAADRAKVGDVQGAVAAYSRMWRLREEFNGRKPVGDVHADLLAIDTSHPVDAVEAISRAARSRQIVILNESHHVPFDRVFAMRLARALKQEGFEYLACETFRANIEHVLDKGYVAQSTGFYSREPTYAKFLTDAQSHGWTFVSYESTGPDNLRESDMARNLIKRIFAVNAKAKIFVYAGYSHAMKLPVSHSDDDGTKLAAQLRRLTGIDPLTINQTTLFQQYNSAQQALYYKHAVKKLRTRSPAVLLSAKGAPVKLSIDSAAYDFEVVHPTYVDDPRTHRAEWLNRDFMPHDIPMDMLPKKGRRAVYAYARGAAPDATPLDVVVLKAGGPVPKLMLPPGDYVYEYED